VPLLTLFTELVEEAAEAAPSRRQPRRLGLAGHADRMFASQSPGVPADGHAHPVTADEVWRFCLGGVSGSLSTV